MLPYPRTTVRRQATLDMENHERRAAYASLWLLALAFGWTEVAPLWAPLTVATLFVTVGSYLFWTSERERRYRWPDIGVLVVSSPRGDSIEEVECNACGTITSLQMVPSTA
jgi:hypothetical protein